jgi:hypothetical protein
VSLLASYGVFFSHFRLSWVMSRWVAELLAYWWTASSMQSAVVWKMVSTCLLWCIWREINDRSFERMLEELILYSSILFIFGQQFLYPLLCLIFMIFLF